MRKFFSRDDVSDLESELRDHRPEPRSDLVDRLVAQVGRETVRTPVRRPRVAAALVFAVVVLVALAAFGGAGYAKSSVASAAKSSSHAVTAVVRKGDDNKSGGQQGNSSNNQGNNGNNNQGNNGNNNNNTQGNNGNNNGNSSGHGNNGGGFPGNGHDPPWVHQYSFFVLICYPYNFGGHVQRRTIVVPFFLVPAFVPPGTLGPCRVPPR